MGVPSPGSLIGILSPCTQVTHWGRRPVPLHSSPSMGILDPSPGHLTWAPPHLGTPHLGNPQEQSRTPWFWACSSHTAHRITMDHDPWAAPS